MKRVDVASALIFDESGQRVVMVLNKKNGSEYWSLPGGAVEQGETLVQAAVREAKEESGLDVAVGRLHSVREVFFKERGSHALLFTFYATATGGRLEILDPDGDIADVRWMTIGEANESMPYLPAPIAPDTSGGATYFFQGER